MAKSVCLVDLTLQFGHMLCNSYQQLKDKLWHKFQDQIWCPASQVFVIHFSVVVWWQGSIYFIQTIKNNFSTDSREILCIFPFWLGAYGLTRVWFLTLACTMRIDKYFWHRSKTQNQHAKINSFLHLEYSQVSLWYGTLSVLLPFIEFYFFLETPPSVLYR